MLRRSEFQAFWTLVSHLKLLDDTDSEVQN